MHGIPNCDSIKKARALMLQPWMDAVGFEVLLNQRGTTWRGLDQARRAAATTAQAAQALMLELPTLIKRPVLVDGNTVLVGFDPARCAAHFKAR
jgi:arsenate reductase